jgi:hypothetical protein
MPLRFGKGVGVRTLTENLDCYVGENGRLRVAVVAHVHRKDRSSWKSAAVFGDPNHVRLWPIRHFRR